LRRANTEPTLPKLTPEQRYPDERKRDPLKKLEQPRDDAPDRFDNDR
jgi:hypothetical protein